MLYLGDEFTPPVHDLATAVYFSIVSMSTVGYGDIVPHAPTARLFEAPQHPYTGGLLACRPRLDGERGASLARIPGSASDLPQQGCAFRPRCALAVERCAHDDPVLREVAAGHQVACHVAVGEDA